MSITSQIVVTDVSVTAAPTASTYQQSGVLVSVGGTTLTANHYLYCANLAAVTAILGGAGNHVELGHMAGTYFAQGSEIGVYVLEIGAQAGVVADQITALGTWITNNPSPWGPSSFYTYLVPATWDTSNAADVNTMAANFASPTSMVYFFVSTTSGTISGYGPTTKSIVATVPSPTAAGTEFQAAAIMHQFLAQDPGPANPATPMFLRYVFGVTPWVLPGNVTTVNTILTAYGNVIEAAAQGSISTASIFRGTMIDGNQMMFWYGIDWVQLQIQTEIAAALSIATNSGNPIVYNQAGINTLLAVAQAQANNGISYDLLLAPATITAVPFATYTKANPSDYTDGAYKGFAGTFTPQNGFQVITFYLTATQVA